MKQILTHAPNCSLLWFTPLGHPMVRCHVPTEINIPSFHWAVHLRACTESRNQLQLISLVYRHVDSSS